MGDWLFFGYINGDREIKFNGGGNIWGGFVGVFFGLDWRRQVKMELYEIYLYEGYLHII